MADDNVQHGIDDNPHGDAGKGAVAGALGGAAVGALAGGPIGAVIGAVAGALASGAAVAAVDSVDNDDTVSGLGDGATTDVDRGTIGTPGYNATGLQEGYSSTTIPDATGTMSTANTMDTSANLPDITPIAGSDTTPSAGMATGADLPDITPIAGTTIGAVPQSGYEQTRTDVTPSISQGSMASTNQTDDRIVVPVVEEQLNVQKGVQQAGEVQVSKQVVTEQVNVPVEVTREEVVVTRHAVDRDLQPGEQAVGQGEEVLRVPVMQETVSVTKTPHVVEEIEIGKTVETQQQNVSDTVRKEVIDVDDTTGTTRNTNL